MAQSIGPSRAPRWPGGPSAATIPAASAATPAVAGRDVYYLVFDRFGGRDALRAEFGYDNGAGGKV